MTQGLIPGLQPDTLLKGRYAVRGRYGIRGAAFLGTDLESGLPVLLLELLPSMVTLVGRAALVGHPHLVTLLDVAPAGSVEIGVFEYVAGRTLEDVLADQGTFPESVAVTCTLALTDALDRLHQRGALHGQIRTRAIVLSEQPGQGPWLGRASLEDYPPSYRCPEHVGGSPSLADDRWAMGALLHELLLGYPPPREGYSDAAALPCTGAMQGDVRSVLAAALATRPERRPKSAAELRDRLAYVKTRLADSERTTGAGQSAGTSDAPWALSQRPERPGRMAPVPRTPAQRRSLRQRSGYAALTVAVGAAGVWFGLGQAARLATRAPVPHPSASTAATLGSLAETLPSGQSSSSREEALATCLRKLFPEHRGGALRTSEELCTTRDPRRGLDLLEQAFGSDPRRYPPLTQATYRWASLAVVRRLCCAAHAVLDFAPIGCQLLGSSLDELTDSLVEGRAPPQDLARYREPEACPQNRPSATGPSLHPATGADDEAFRHWLARAVRAVR